MKKGKKKIKRYSIRSTTLQSVQLVCPVYPCRQEHAEDTPGCVFSNLNVTGGITN